MTREFPKNPEQKIEPAARGRIVMVTILGAPEPLAAIVAKASPDGMHVNVTIFNEDGSTGPLIGVPHASIKPSPGYSWDWMAYQKGQARKAQELEELLGRVRDEKWAVDLAPKQGGGRLDADESGKLQAAAPSPVDGKH